MHTGTVEYSARTEGVEIEAFSVESPHANIDTIGCHISNDGIVAITAALEDVYYEDWPLTEVGQEVQQFVDVLSFQFNCPIHALRQSGLSLKMNDDSGRNRMCSDLVVMWDNASAIIKPGANSLELLRQRFVNSRRSSTLRLYAAAIQQKDPIARFMFLYNIILTLSRDRQAEVDNNILNIAPETPLAPSPHNPNAQETVYTRLRNEIAHNRVGADFNATSTEVTEKVSELSGITKQLILNNG